MVVVQSWKAAEKKLLAGSAALGELGRCQRTGRVRDWPIGSVGNPTVFRHARRSAGQPVRCEGLMELVSVQYV